MSVIDGAPLLSAHSVANMTRLAAAFRFAKPFKHVVIDNFFEDSFAQQLLDEFPRFDQKYAVDEYGRPSRKAVVEQLSALSGPFMRVDQFFASETFLQWVSQVTGVRNLIYDPDNYGGGTHENLDGQELLPHVDFNYHPKTGHHRRLNLIVYLNREWNDAWGGSIQIHSDPRNPATNDVTSFAPTFNRCIIFETNEYSWHGFDRIVLPNGQKHNSRKSLSLYLYTKDRAEDEVFAPHGTFYVPRPLPQDIVPGKVLSESDIAAINYLLRSRDDLIELQQKQEADRSGNAAKLAAYTAELRVLVESLKLPLLGYVKQIGPATGLFPDQWFGHSVSFRVHALRAISGIEITGIVHTHLPANSTLSLVANGEEIAACELTGGNDVQLSSQFHVDAGADVDITLRSSATVIPAAVGVNKDARELCINLYNITFNHTKY